MPHLFPFFPKVCILAFFLQGPIFCLGNLFPESMQSSWLTSTASYFLAKRLRQPLLLVWACPSYLKPFPSFTVPSFNERTLKVTWTRVMKLVLKYFLYNVHQELRARNATNNCVAMCEALVSSWQSKAWGCSGDQNIQVPWCQGCVY